MDPDPDPGGQKKNFHVFMDVLFCGLKASPVAWTSFMDGGQGISKKQFFQKYQIFVSAVICFQFLVIRTLYPDPDGYLS